MAVAERAFGEAADARARSRTPARALALPLAEAALAAGIFAAALFVYNLTLTPSLSYVSLDGNELATVPYQLGLAHSTGYPLYTWAGKLFTFIPIGDVAHRMNLMSAAGAAGGCALLFAIVLMVIRDGEATEAGAYPARAGLRPWLPAAGAALGALTLAFSKTLWSQAVIAEVYAPNVFMVGLSFALLLVWGRHERRRLALTRAQAADARSLALFGAFALAFGLSLGTHMSDLALAPGFIAFVLLTNWRLALQPKFVLAGALGFGLGALQFAWLPYKAAQLNDAALARNTPDDLRGIYDYTLNAFPQLKWAFPMSVMPDRVVMYLRFLWANFWLGGIGLAVFGGFAMAARNPRAFFLFLPGYVLEMAFFLEYRASDIDVFFITAHFITAVFAGYGAWGLFETGHLAWQRLRSAPNAAAPNAAAVEGPPRRRRTWALRAALAAAAAASVVAAAVPAVSLARNWAETDQSANTGINDFYEDVFATLPQDSALIGRGGVFGYDMFYWRYVYNVRPDVYIPLAIRFDNGRLPANTSATFTITPPGGQGGFGGPSPAPRGLQSQSAWYWPVMAAPVETDETAALEMPRQLTLFQEHAQPPQLFVTGAAPQHEVNATFGSVTLVGYDLGNAQVNPGGTVHLRLYWQTNGSVAPQVSTKVGDTKYFEAHQLGFGNLSRYLQTQGPPPAGSLLVEDYDLVVLSSLDKGTQPFAVRVSFGPFAGQGGEWVQVGTIEVK
jgi:hypothetical protein